jgi:hypothetical protein
VAYLKVLSWHLPGETEGNIYKKFWKQLICLFSLHYFNILNSLQRHDLTQNDRILHRMDQCLSQHNLNISDRCVLKLCQRN